MSRKHISLKTKLAATLLTLGDIPYEDTKGLSADEIIGQYHFDHGILHAIEPIDEPWNLTPRLIAEHRRKTRTVDIPAIAKSKRITKAQAEFRQRLLAKGSGIPAPKSRWPKRPFLKRV